MLHENCRKFLMDSNNKVVGVELKIIDVPNAKFTIHSCKLQNEYESGNRHIAYSTFVNPIDMTGYNVALCYPYENKPEFRYILLPGNNKGEHVIVNGYNPPELGYLSLCIVDSNKKVVSDILVGLGLPFNHHISYNIEWRVKDQDTNDDTDDTDDTDDNEYTKNLKLVLSKLTTLTDGIKSGNTILMSINTKLDRLINFIEGD